MTRRLLIAALLFVVVHVIGLCSGECVQLQSLLKIEFGGHNDDNVDSKGYPCVIRMGQPPDGLNWAHFEKLMCERDFDNGAFTPWRCAPRKSLPSRYTVRYWIVCRHQGGKPYEPDVLKLVNEADDTLDDDDDSNNETDLQPLLLKNDVFCSLRYKAEIDPLWITSNAISIVLSIMAVFAFLVIIFVYRGPIATGMSGTAMLSNLLLNAGAYEALNHLDYVDRTTVVYFLVVRIVILAVTIAGLILYMENQRTPFWISLRQLKDDLRDESEDGEEAEDTDDVETGVPRKRKRRNVNENPDASESPQTMVVVVAAESATQSDNNGHAPIPKEPDAYDANSEQGSGSCDDDDGDV